MKPGPAVEDLTGRIFGRLEVLGRAIDPLVKWHCQCECGTLRIVAGRELRSGNTQSCGCLHREAVAEAARQRTGKRCPLRNPQPGDVVTLGNGTRREVTGRTVRRVQFAFYMADGRFAGEEWLELRSWRGACLQYGTVLHMAA